MIDAKELRIGNFVLLDDGVWEIISIDSYGIYDIYHADSGRRIERFNSEIEPIPLTEGLLLKCGFKKTGDFAFEYKDDADLIFDAPNDWENTGDYPVGISSIDPGYPAMYIPHGEVIIRCLYLHDLQNKFFAITGKELEVDL